MGKSALVRILSRRFEPQSRAHHQEKVSWVKTGKDFWLLINVKQIYKCKKNFSRQFQIFLHNFLILFISVKFFLVS